MPSKNIAQCPVCNKNVNKLQNSTVCCKCEICFHNDCTGLTDESLSDINKKKSKYICKTCKNSSTVNNNDIIKIMEEIKESIENKLETTTNNIECRMDNGFKNLDR